MRKILAWAATCATLLATSCASGPRAARRSPEEVTIERMRDLGTGLMYWLYVRSNHLTAAETQAYEEAARQRRDTEPWRPPNITVVPEIPPLGRRELERLLHPPGGSRFMEGIPRLDGWGRPIEVVGDLENLLYSQVFVIRSAGANGAFEGSSYQFGRFAQGVADDDIVWRDGFFVRWPLELEIPDAEPGLP
jgi:hypothetical protein